MPHESELGAKLRLRVEVLAQYTDQLSMHGQWRLLTIEAQTVSKFAALLDRPDTEKGFKDAREITQLLEKGVDADIGVAILAEASSLDVFKLREHLSEVFELLGPRARLNKQQRRDMTRTRRRWDDAIQALTPPAGRERPALE